MASNTLFPRSSGVLLHPTSLPGRYGIGDLGQYAYQFVDWLAAAGQSIWQVLPLGPTSYGDSPYQCLSAFAGNPNLISLDVLQAKGWLTAVDLAKVPDFPPYKVDFGPVVEWRTGVLATAYRGFKARATAEQKAAFQTWCQQEAAWLEDFALFAALKAANGGRPWVEWAPDEALRKPAAIASARETHAEKISEVKFLQWCFFSQWLDLRDYAHSKGIRLVGDIPIFVAHDSSDVWGNPQFFYLEPSGKPTVIAGVPPDYFSPTGQRWGNPLYRWDVMKADGYRWWIERIRATLATVDAVRIDHFRGFEAYWEVPASEATAIKGEWIPGPKFDLFEAIQKALGSNLPIIAEDLGVITEGVIELRDGLGLPGMNILQFAFGGSGGENRFLPHHHVQNSVVYSGTHDNNTTLGWWMDPKEVSADIREYLKAYVGHEVQEPHWELIRMGMASVAHTFVAPMQDILGFGADTRMNTPGKESGNWGWRFTADWLQHPNHQKLAWLTKVFDRWPAKTAS